MKIENQNEIKNEIENEIEVKSEIEIEVKNEIEPLKKKSVKLKVLKGLKKYLTKKIIIVIVILASIGTVGVGLRTFFSVNSKTTRIGFEDIGEFATQTAYCTALSVTDKSRDLFGITIPFTQSKYIYSYDIFIKAGFDFKDIEWNKNGTSIEVKLPEAKVLSSEIDLDSFKIYHEDESIFTQIDMIESNEGMKNLKETAEKDAIVNGLLDNARANVEIILTGFFANAYDLNEYEIIFKDK